MTENSCFVLLSNGPLGSSVSTIAFYSHLVPATIAIFIGLYLLFRTRLSKLAVVFLFFTFSFSMWLVFDVVPWTSSDYSHVFYFWSSLDYINVVFFALGAYFFGVLAREKISIWEKLIIVVTCIPAFWVTFSGNSVTNFYQPWCEVTENGFMTIYKLYAEAIFVILILISFFISWNKSDKKKKIQISVVLAAILAFFGVFSSTEYIATITNVYEINLYGLFVLPLFLITMVFAVTNLGVFKIRFLGTQLLVYTLIIMIGSQFLFLESSTDAVLNTITLVVTIFFSPARKAADLPNACTAS